VPGRERRARRPDRPELREARGRDDVYAACGVPAVKGLVFATMRT